MSTNNDELLYDEDDSVKFIQNYLPQELKGKFSNDDINYIVDLIYDFYESNGMLDDDGDDEIEIDEEEVVSYVIKKGTGMVMAPGMVFTIEPMINAGLPDIYIDEGNNWTIYTDDDSYSAQWEIMVHVTEDGYEVMSY